MRKHGLIGLVAVLALPLLAIGKGPPAEDPGAADVLARNLRRYLLEHLPPVLFENSSNWGHQKQVTRGLRWEDDGKVLPQRQKKHKNQGVWRKTRVTPVTPQSTLVLQIRDVKKAGPDRRTFTTALGLELRVEAEQQNWRMGIRTLSSSFKARVRVLVTLNCEMTTKLVKGSGLLPDIVVRMRVLSSRIDYGDFVTEHALGVGGEVAEWIGDAGHRLLKLVKPSLEQKLLEKANAAIVKAADTKEVRVSLGGLLPK